MAPPRRVCTIAQVLQKPNKIIRVAWNADQKVSISFHLEQMVNITTGACPVKSVIQQATFQRKETRYHYTKQESVFCTCAPNLSVKYLSILIIVEVFFYLPVFRTCLDHFGSALRLCVAFKKGTFFSTLALPPIKNSDDPVVNRLMLFTLYHSVLYTCLLSSCSSSARRFLATLLPS